MAAGPRRAPDVGSASNGKPPSSANRTSAGPSAASRSARPATTTARGRAVSSPATASTTAAAGAATWRVRVTHGRPPARPPPPGSSAASGASSTSGSRSEKFRWTGPGRPSSAVQHARQASWRIQRSRSGVAGWSSTSMNHLAALP